MVRNALHAGLTVPAFNIPYLAMMEPVVRAVRDADAAAFIATARVEWLHFESGGPGPVAERFAACADPRHVRLHLDHVPVIDEDGRQVCWQPIFEQALALGYGSVMIDASRLELEGNIAVTAQAVRMAHAAGAACEAELGSVLGHEAGPLPPYDELFSSGLGFTDVEQARRFVAETGCDWLSVAVGSVHGAIVGASGSQQKVSARLHLERLSELAEATGIPLVLHGGSGIPCATVQAAVRCGIAKLNVATEIRRAWLAALEGGGDQEAAQAAVYHCTRALLEEHLSLGATRAAVMGEA